MVTLGVNVIVSMMVMLASRVMRVIVPTAPFAAGFRMFWNTSAWVSSGKVAAIGKLPLRVTVMVAVPEVTGVSKPVICLYGVVARDTTDRALVVGGLGRAAQSEGPSQTAAGSQ